MPYLEKLPVGVNRGVATPSTARPVAWLGGEFMTASIARIRAGFVAVCLGLTVSGCGYNTIPTYEEQAKAKWSDVQNNYQRRADLIPNLVETVKGFAQQERTVLEAVTNARARATSIQVNADTITD